ncbi:MAG TPA: hypothetical protein VM406_02010, partial [Noviherbaspirillum sp.]|nr:hypothetical protein [Noviherbaspirillum sp.]
MRPEPRKRSDYLHFHTISTRWMDNDAYGHVNNVVYYSWFDTVVNRFLVAGGGHVFVFTEDADLVAYAGVPERG